MPKAIKPSPKGEAAGRPAERLSVACSALEEMDSLIEGVVRDIDACNLALLSVDTLERIEAQSKAQPIAAHDKIEALLDQLEQLEDSAKSAAKEAREAGKLAEHLAYAVRSLYRDVIARGEQEKARRAEAESRNPQQPLRGVN
jgi:uncharacterized protein (UPF0335 family)